MNNVHLLQLNGEKESNMMERKLTQGVKRTGLQLNPRSSKSCATYVGTKTIQDLDIDPKDFAVKSQQHSEKECDVMVTKPKQAEESTKFQPNYNSGKSSAPHLGCKARQKLNLLTEEEKEERRLRRVLANRESARQAILRRQARHQELARRAAELECENKKLKKEKEVAMKEYESLRSTNESLKAQLKLKRVTVDVEVTETQEGLKFNNARLPTPTPKCPQLYTSHQPPSLPYVLPFIIPGPIIVPSAPHNGILNTSQIPMIPNGKTSFLFEHKNPVGMNVPGNPYAFPHPWLFPLSYHANGVQSLDFASKRYITKESSTSSFRKTVAVVKDDQRFPPKMVRGEASTSTKKIGPSVEVYSGKASGKKPAHKYKATSERNEETVIGSSVRQKNAMKRRSEFITSAAATSSSQQNNEDRTEGTLLRRQMDAFTAAEARKRRKEVVKTKNFQYARQSHVKMSSI